MLNFLCVGAQKAGTTWLFRHLNNSPEVSFPLGKEVHYWDWVERQKRPSDPDRYISYFNKHDDLLYGDMTPCYAILTTKSIQEIHTLYPDVKIVYIIRNPIDRAWSAFKMGMSIMRMEPHEVSKQGMRDVLTSASSIQRGDHYTILKNWRSVFSHEQILVMNFDDLVKDNERFLTQAFNFLDLDTTYIQKLTNSQLNARVNQGISMSMPDDIRAELLTIYKEKIINLQDYLGNDLSHWV